MIHFCTYFDQRYLARGLVLYQSLLRHCRPFQLWVLCLDEDTFEVLGSFDLPSITLISMADFEAADAELAAVRSNRSLLEYYFTCTPRLPLHVFEQAPDIDSITYVDADMYFFANPSSLLQGLAGSNVAITPHSFGAYDSDSKLFGRYNVGWLSFRRNQITKALLLQWRRQCIEWCYLRDDDDRFAEQKYLDSWPEGYPGVRVIEVPTVGLGPWNLGRHRVSLADGQATVDGYPMVCFHFSGLVRVNPWLWDSNLPMFGANPAGLVRSVIYRPYLTELGAAERRITPFRLKDKPLRTLHDSMPRRWALLAKLPLIGKALRSMLHVWRGIVGRGYFYVLGGRVL